MSNNLIDLKKVKEYSEILLLFVAFFYVIGFVIVSSYSVKYGIHLEDFFSAKYLAAAICYFLTLSVFLSIRFAIKTEEGSKKIEINPKGLKWALVFVYVIWVSLFNAHPFRKGNYAILSLALVFLVLVPIFFYNEKRKNKYLLFPIPQLIFITFFATPEFSYFLFNIFFIYLGYKIVKRFLYFKEKKEKNILTKFDMGLSVFMFLILIITNTFGFGYMTYQTMPRYLGGGRPLKISLYVNDGEQKIFEELGIKFDQNGWSENLELIYRDRYSIYLNKAQPFKFSALEVKLDNIENIKYTGDYKLTFWEMTKEIFRYKEYLKISILEMLKADESGERPILNRKVLGNMEGAPLLIIYNMLNKPDKFQEAIEELQQEKKIKVIYDEKRATKYIDYISETNPIAEIISKPVTKDEKYMWNFVSLEKNIEKVSTEKK